MEASSPFVPLLRGRRRGKGIFGVRGTQGGARSSLALGYYLVVPFGTTFSGPLLDADWRLVSERQAILLGIFGVRGTRGGARSVARWAAS